MFMILMSIRLVILVCSIVVLFRQFQNAGVLHGIIGILTCFVWTFIWGWMNAFKLDLRNLMSVWTLLVVIYVTLGFIFGFTLGLESLISHILH